MISHASFNEILVALHQIWLPFIATASGWLSPAILTAFLVPNREWYADMKFNLIFDQIFFFLLGLATAIGTLLMQLSKRVFVLSYANFHEEHAGIIS